MGLGGHASTTTLNSIKSVLYCCFPAFDVDQMGAKPRYLTRAVADGVGGVKSPYHAGASSPLVFVDNISCSIFSRVFQTYLTPSSNSGICIS